MLKRLLAIAAVALVAGCGSLGTSDPNALAKGLITACESAASGARVIRVLVDAGRIKPPSFPAIEQARVTIDGFCDPNAAMPADLIGATNRVVAATAAMLAYKPKE